jgi:hypothetical protein
MKACYFVPITVTLPKNTFYQTTAMQYAVFLTLTSASCPGGTCYGESTTDISSGHSQFQFCYFNPPTPGFSVILNCQNGESIQETFDEVTNIPQDEIACPSGFGLYLITTTLSPIPSSDCVVVDILADENDICEISCI